MQLRIKCCINEERLKLIVKNSYKSINVLKEKGQRIRISSLPKKKYKLLKNISSSGFRN